MIVQRVLALILHRMRQPNVFYVTMACVIIANLFVMYLFYRNYQARQSSKAQASTEQHSHLHTGQIMPRFSAKSIYGSLVDSASYQGKWLLAIYYGAEPNPNYLTHSQALFEKYGNKGFQPLAIINGDAEEIGKIVAGDISYPIMLDLDHSLADTLHLHGEETGTFFVDPSGNIKFSVPDIPNQSSLRQLVERYVVNWNTPEAKPKSSDSLKTGSSIPPIKIKDVRTGIELSSSELGLANASLIFFGLTVLLVKCQPTSMLFKAYS